jgi:hypothetical protein
MGGYFYVMSPRTLVMSLICAVLCAVLQGATGVFLAPLAIPGLSFPFCIAGVLFVALQSSFPGFESIPLGSITVPENHILEARWVLGPRHVGWEWGGRGGGQALSFTHVCDWRWDGGGGA